MKRWSRRKEEKLISIRVPGPGQIFFYGSDWAKAFIVKGAKDQDRILVTWAVLFGSEDGLKHS